MKSWSYLNSTRIEATSIDGLSAIMKSLTSLDGKWLLVTSEGMTRRGVSQRVVELTSDYCDDWYVHDCVTPNPELNDLDAVSKILATQDIVGIVAIGGGSVLDAAKVLAVTIPCDLDDVLRKCLRESHGQNWSRKIPMIAVPTTSGTGAEVTPFATVWDQTEHKKYSVTGPHVSPDVALLDPKLLLTLPYSETLNTGLDAISHACESLWNVNKTPVSEAYARFSLKLAIESFPKVLSNPDDIEARCAMQNASLLSGMAISQTRTAIAHAISYPLTSHFGVPHGLACSFTLPNLIKQFIEQCDDVELVGLLESVKEMLDSFHLFEKLLEYATYDQIMMLKAEMYHPERAGNLSFKINSLESVLSDGS